MRSLPPGGALCLLHPPRPAGAQGTCGCCLRGGGLERLPMGAPPHPVGAAQGQPGPCLHCPGHAATHSTCRPLCTGPRGCPPAPLVTQLRSPPAWRCALHPPTASLCSSTPLHACACQPWATRRRPASSLPTPLLGARVTPRKSRDRCHPGPNPWHAGQPDLPPAEGRAPGLQGWQWLRRACGGSGDPLSLSWGSNLRRRGAAGGRPCLPPALVLGWVSEQSCPRSRFVATCPAETWLCPPGMRTPRLFFPGRA